MRPDGSGTWTRLDAAASRYRTLYLSGPSVSEITSRETFCGKSGDLIDVTRDYPGCRDKSAPLPPPVPRSIRTVFHFARTNAVIPPDASYSKDPESASTGPPGTETPELGAP